MPTPSQPLVWADGKWMMKRPTSFALKPQTCPEKSGISFWPQGGRRRNTHLVQRCWRSSAFCHSATPPLGVHKTCSRSTAEQNVSSMDLQPQACERWRPWLCLGSQLSVEHSGLGKPLHCRPGSTSCKRLMNWAWLTPLAGPLLITTRFGLSPVERNEQIAYDAPYLLLSLLCTWTCFAPFLFLDVLCFEESQAGLCSFP